MVKLSRTSLGFLTLGGFVFLGLAAALSLGLTERVLGAAEIDLADLTGALAFGFAVGVLVGEGSVVAMEGCLKMDWSKQFIPFIYAPIVIFLSSK